MSPRQYEVLFMDENVWTVDGKPDIFNSWKEAKAELEEHFFDMREAEMSYEPSDYRIVRITK
jgi:hypothetical protein